MLYYLIIWGGVCGTTIIVTRGGRKKRVVIKEVQSSTMVNVDRVRICGMKTTAVT